MHTQHLQNLKIQLCIKNCKKKNVDVIMKITLQ